MLQRSSLFWASGSVWLGFYWVATYAVIQSGCTTSPSSATPIATGLVVLTPSIEVSAQDQGAAGPQKAVVRLKNYGPHEARIERVTTGCHCVTVMSSPQSPIATNHECEIALQVTPPQYGEQSVRVSTYIAGGNAPLITNVLAKGRPLPVPRVVRPMTDLTLRGTRGDALSAKFAILTVEKQDEPPWLSGFKTDVDNFKIELDAPPEEQSLVPGLVQRKYTAILTSLVQFSDSTDQFFTVASMFHSRPATKDATFRVHVHVQDPIRAIPALINLRLRTLPIRRELWLISEDNVSWDVELAEQLPPWMHCAKPDSEHEGGNSHSHRFVLEFEPPADLSTIRSTILLKTTHPRHPQIEIPVHIVAE